MLLKLKIIKSHYINFYIIYFKRNCRNCVIVSNIYFIKIFISLNNYVYLANFFFNK